LPLATFSTGGGEGATWSVTDLEPAPSRTDFTVLAPGGRYAGGVPLAGAYNVSNALAAIAAAGEAGLDPAAVAQGLAGLAGVPGRLESIRAG
ncbi:Mur ligase family protein, partial [Klebsiella pneumoniae]|nr:Mur ligase family protein [Klebsiella pneumoniae]